MEIQLNEHVKINFIFKFERSRFLIKTNVFLSSICREINATIF